MTDTRKTIISKYKFGWVALIGPLTNLVIGLKDFFTALHYLIFSSNFCSSIKKSAFLVTSIKLSKISFSINSSSVNELLLLSSELLFFLFSISGIFLDKTCEILQGPFLCRSLILMQYYEEKILWFLYRFFRHKIFAKVLQNKFANYFKNNILNWLLVYLKL